MSDVLEIPKLEPGIYEHYKGNRYKVVGVGVDTETEQPVVIYQPIYSSDVSFWVRPYDMFVGTVDVGGNMIPRFKKIVDYER
ncbi:MAG TPA: DUF1653 domain-containing protein [Candidatus Saccharibacteria bacterium]|nr:DUF1653 domain-containing protein [Candidatus Saccharibacteria bacterium]